MRSKPSPFQMKFIEVSCLWLGAIVLTFSLLRVVLSGFPLVRLLVPIMMGFWFFYSAFKARKGLATQLTGYQILIALFLMAINASYVNGGVRAPVVAAVILFPIFGTAALGKKGAWISAILALLALGIIILLEALGVCLPYQSGNEIIYYPLIFSGGIAVCFSTVLAIEKARVASELELLKVSEALVNSAKYSSLGEMASGMAHEINNPLAIIDGKTSLLLRKLNEGPLDSNESKVALEKILFNAQRISKSMSALRDFTGTLKADEVSNENLLEIVNASLELCHERFANNGIKLTIDIDDKIQVTCSKNKLMQIILNLLINSFDALQPAEEKWIKIIGTLENGSALLSIIDSGPGIPKEIQSKIMQPFFTTKPAGKGSGLGLSVSHGLAKSMDGSLYFDQQSINTKFTVRLIFSNS